MKRTFLAARGVADQCAMTGALLLALALSSHAFAERKYSDWGPPVNLGCGTINSPANDLGPAISKDGRSLYFTSTRAGGFGDNDLYVVQRPSTADAWGDVQNLGPSINTAATESNPSFSRDGHLMFFNSNREGGFGDVDLWASYREHVHDDFAWQPPVNLGAGVNAPERRGDELYQFQAGAGYFENEGGVPQLYFGIGLSQAMQGTTDIYVADLLPEGFGNRRPVPELNSPQGDQRPSIRFDGLEIFFFSNRPGGLGSTDIWVATRESVNEPWNAPKNLEPVVNSTFGEFNPHISADGLTLHFASNRPAGHPDCGLIDLYMTTRTKLKGNER